MIQTDRSRIGQLIPAISLALLILTLSGCSSFGYYLDLMAGHSEMMEKREQVTTVINNENTPAALKNILKNSIKIRDFASKNLYLPENKSYRLYADIKRRYAVWNVVATPEFSVKAKKWCFLFVGCLNYRGYFRQQQARDFAKNLQQQGFDVMVGGASAYSTLGWFDDPLLNTMLYQSEARRAGVIFHELAHQKVYIENDTAFNEAFAMAVEEEGVRRWFKSQGKEEKYQQYLQNKKRNQALNDLLLSTRERLEKLYQQDIDDKQKRAGKKKIFSELKKQYQRLKQKWKGDDRYDQWMQQNLNNAHLLLIATYNELVPAFKKLLQKQGNDLRKFYQKVAELGEQESEKRKQILAEM